MSVNIYQIQGYAPLYSDKNAFYVRNGYRFGSDCCNRPICSTPGVEIVVKERFTPDNGLTFKYITKIISIYSFIIF